MQCERVVSNDYVVRWANRFYQLLPPVYPGERGGRVVIEQRLDGTVAVRFGQRYLKYEELTGDESLGGSAPKPPEFSAMAADARCGKRERGVSCEQPRSAGMQPAAGRSGRTPAEPYPPDGEAGDTPKGSYRPAENHPWRKSLK